MSHPFIVMYVATVYYAPCPKEFVVSGQRTTYKSECSLRLPAVLDPDMHSAID